MTRSVRRTCFVALMAICIFASVHAQQPINATAVCGANADENIPAEQYVSARLGQTRGDQIYWQPFALDVWQGVNRYVYTYPPPGGMVEWAYELVPEKDCIVSVTIAWAETAYQFPKGKGGPARRLDLIRNIGDVGNGVFTEELIGTFAGQDTGGWEKFEEKTFARVALKQGFRNRLVLRTKSSTPFYPIPHVLYLRVKG